MVGQGAILVGLLFTCGIYLMLSFNTQRLAMGFLLLSNAVNVVVLVASGIPAGATAAFVGVEGGPHVDPLPHAFVLTAIVITLGAVALLFAMAARARKESGTDDLRDEVGTVALDEGTAASGAGTVTSGQETVTSGQETVTSGQETVTSGQETVTSGQETVTSGEETVTSRQGTVTSGQGTVTSGQETVTSDEGAVTSGEGTVASDEGPE
ncbi:MAG: NADH-quinone oxidoreductase subunit K [Myxococcales bacterium]